MLAAAEWDVIHAEVLCLARARAQHEHALGRALLRAHEARIWEPLGLATFREYAARFVGLSRRQTDERLRAARALRDLPLVDGALAAGTLAYTAVRELTRVVTPANQNHWLVAVQSKTVGEIEKLVASHEPGDAPTDPPRPTRHRVTLNLSSEAFAVYREAVATLRAQHDLSEENAVLHMARTVLAGRLDQGTSAHQVQVTVCERCARDEQREGGTSIPVEPAVVAPAICDAPRMGPGETEAPDISPATRRAVIARDHGHCRVPGCRNATFTQVHHIDPREEQGSHDAENLVVLCGVHCRAVQQGTLLLKGTTSAGLEFSHPDGGRFGDVLRDIFGALRGLGFKRHQARAVVEEIRPQVRDSTTTEEAMVIALRVAGAHVKAGEMT